MCDHGIKTNKQNVNPNLHMWKTNKQINSKAETYIYENELK